MKAEEYPCLQLPTSCLNAGSFFRISFEEQQGAKAGHGFKAGGVLSCPKHGCGHVREGKPGKTLYITKPLAFQADHEACI